VTTVADGGPMTTVPAGSPAPFTLPAGLVATAPPEARGLARDGVRLMVASAAGIEHRTASALPAVLRAGDLLVLNTSDTLPAALRGVGADGALVEVHLSTLDPAAGAGYPQALAGGRSRWVVEVREPGGYGGTACYADRSGAELRLAGGGRLRIDGSVPAGRTTSRLWAGELVTPGPLLAWLRGHGDPIRYGYISAPWPISAYRNSYADTPGSVELPSAGRALTPRLLRRLRARGVQVAALVLHCGCPRWKAATRRTRSGSSCRAPPRPRSGPRGRRAGG
jgi:S-adenosylmethionine:tRNA ribosyltransferase-isomerase